MIIRSSSLPGLDRHMMVYLIIAIALTLVPASNSAPMYESDQTELENYGESTGCYYNYNHYGEGDRIMTNEPCLNCTCHDRMLMCYLRVCPFTKAIGQDCTIEKREDQCCPVITCPEVEVQLLDHQTTANPSNALGATSSSEVGAPDQFGCSINGRFYPEGAQVPSNPLKPCELCYCIRNMTTCVMQECTLHIDGCQPIYNKGVCCPVKYDCDHDKDSTPMLEDESTTTVRPTPGFILTTTVSPSVSTDCVHNGETYADGALIMTDKPCEHCYCMRGDIVCAVQECGTPLENEGKNCTALPPAVGQCCPDKYLCDGSAAAMPTTTSTVVPSMATAAADEQEEDQQQEEDDSKTAKPDQEATFGPTTQTSTQGSGVEGSSTMATVEQKVPAASDDDKGDDQQEQEHVAPQFEDVATDDSQEEDTDNDEQVPAKADDEQRLTTAQPAVSEKPAAASDHIPGHEDSHEKEETTTVGVASDTPALATTVRPSSVDDIAQDETSTETHGDDAEAPGDIVGTTVAPAQKDGQDAPEAEQVPLEQDEDEPAGTTVRPINDIVEADAVTTALPSADEKENEIDEHHDEATESDAVPQQPDHDDAATSDEHDEQEQEQEQEKEEEKEQEKEEEYGTTTVRSVQDDKASVPEMGVPVPSSDVTERPEQDKPEVSTEKKEAAQKADDQPEQDFVELPPAVVVTELPPVPTTADDASATEQTPEPPKDEILPNLPLEADSHVLSDAMTTEHAPTFGDRKEDDAPQQPGADMEEPVEMNTIIPLETDGQKMGQPLHEDHEEPAVDKEQEQEQDVDDGQSGEEQDRVTPAKEMEETPTHATPAADKPEADDDGQQQALTPDKLFPESIPGEGDCLIDGVTYENGASVPPTGKCQVACHCSNSIVHCEMVRCKAAPSDDCTPKSTVSGECCPTYVCPKEATSTVSSVSVESTEASTESDADSDEEQVSADVSAESSESPTKAPVVDSQSTSTKEEEDDDAESDDESGQPSEAESDSAGFDVDDDVFKPLRPQEPSLDMHIDYFAGNRPTTANYDDDIVLSTAAPTYVPALHDSVSDSVASQHTTVGSQHVPTEGTPSPADEQQKVEESTTLGAVAERGPEAEQDENEIGHEQDEVVQPTTVKTLAAESETTTAVPVDDRVESSSVPSEAAQIEVTTGGVELDSEQRVTSPAAADEPETDDGDQQHAGSGAADDEVPEHDATTAATSSTPAAEIDRDEEEQERPAPTTTRPAEPTVSEVTTEQQSNDIESDDVSSAAEGDDKPSAAADDEDIPAQPATTTARTIEAEVTTMAAEQDEQREQQTATTTPAAAPEQDDQTGEQQQQQQQDELESVEPTAPSTGKPVMEAEQTTAYVQDAETASKQTTVADEETPAATTVPAVPAEKESDVAAVVTVPSTVDEEREDRTTEQAQKATTVAPTMDDSIVFRVDDDEEEPIVKPTLDEAKPTQVAAKPQTVDREETDDDNLISPEQDGGFHFPQEDDDDDEADEPIFKPTLDEKEEQQHVAMPLPVEVPQETVPLEPVDQIKEQDDEVGQGTTVRSERVTVAPATVEPAKEHDRDQSTAHDDADESNEIEADVQQVATPVKKPEPEVPMYDDVEEGGEQATVAPTKHTPELTTVGQTKDTERQPTTERYDVSTEKVDDDEQEQPATTTRPEQEQDEKEADETVPTLPELDSVQPTTTRASAQDEEPNVTTGSPGAAQDEREQDSETTPPAPMHEDVQSEEDEEDHAPTHPDEKDEDVPAVATTPRVSLDDDSQQEGEDETAKDQVDQDDQDDEDVTAKATAASYDEVQTTTASGVVKQTHAPATTPTPEQSTTLAGPVQDAGQEEERPDFGGVDSDAANAGSEEEDDEPKETVTKVPAVQAATDTSDELGTPAESTTKADDDSGASTEATLKDSEEDQKVDDADQDADTRTTFAPQVVNQDKKQTQPESEPAQVTDKPAGTESVAPVEDDVDFEQEQQTMASPTTPQSADEREKPTTTSALPVDDDKLPESLSTGVSTEQEVPVTTVRATEFDFNLADTHQEQPLAEPEDDGDVQDEIGHSTTFATPEAPEKKPAENADEGVPADETTLATTFDEPEKPSAQDDEEDVQSGVPVTTGASVDDDDSHEEDDADGDEGGQLTTVGPKPIREEERPASTTVAAVPEEPAERDETSEGSRPIDREQESEQTSEPAVTAVPESDDKVQSPAAATDKPTGVHGPAEPATTSEEEQDDVEQPQTDDLNADDDSSEEEDAPVAPTTTATPVKASTVSEGTTATEEVTPKADVYTTLPPISDSQVTEQQTTVRQEDEPSAVSTVAPAPAQSNEAAVTQPAEDATSQATGTTVSPQDEEKEHTAAPAVSQDEVSEVSSVTPAVTTSQPTEPTKAEEPVREMSTSSPAQDELAQTTVAPALAQDDKQDDKLDDKQDDKLDDRLDDRLDDEQDEKVDDQVEKKPSVPVQEEEKEEQVAQKKPEPAGDDSDEQQAAVKPTFAEDEEDDQQKVQEPETTGLHDESGATPAKPTQQPETVGPSYGAPGQHYDTGYGHMPPHYPPSSYEDDYGEEEDPAAFGPGTCRYGGKLYVSAQQIPRDDPCDFCFCFRSDIICLQQSCPPPISGCNEEPIAGFCCPRYECPVSMATVLNVTTSTTTTTTTLPPHFLSHAYKGHVQKRGCQIQGKPYNVGETVASASGPCMRCTCGGDGQMQCEPKACSPEPMLQQMIAVAAARRR